MSTLPQSLISNELIFEGFCSDRHHCIRRRRLLLVPWVAWVEKQSGHPKMNEETRSTGSCTLRASVASYWLLNQLLIRHILSPLLIIFCVWFMFTYLLFIVLYWRVTLSLNYTFGLPFVILRLYSKNNNKYLLLMSYHFCNRSVCRLRAWNLFRSMVSSVTECLCDNSKLHLRTHAKHAQAAAPLISFRRGSLSSDYFVIW